MKIKRDDKAEKILKALMLGAASLSFVLAVSITLRVTIDDEDNTNIESSSIVETTTGTTSTTLTTTTTTLTTTSTASTSTTTTTEETTTTTTTTDMKDSLTYLGSFTGTYFKGDTDPCNGGSGRILIPCDIKDDTYKGSVASQFVFNQYGYERNGKTMIYIEFPTIPEMNGWYSVDDYNADPSIIDFYFPDYSKCPWENDGVIQCVAWIS